jgi:O-antigen ligase
MRGAISRSSIVSRLRSALPVPIPALLLGLALLGRILIDERSSPGSRQSGNFDLSGAIALAFVLAGAVLLWRNRRFVRATAATTLWLVVFTAIAVASQGASSEALREGVREGSVVALAVVVCNLRTTMGAVVVARIVQLAALAPAIVAIHQLATGTGVDVGGQLRANGTLAHPDSAAMLFALAAIACAWLYLDGGRRVLDAASVALYATALIATFSIGGVITLAAMLVALGALHRGARRERLLAALAAVLLLGGFFATPLGAHRLSRESSTSLSAEARGESNTSLAWRLHKWRLMLSRWEGSPAFGRGLGTTVTERPAPGNRYAGEPPHDEYVRYLVETGAVGLALLLYGLSLLLIRLVRMRRSQRQQLRAYADEAVLAIVVLLGCLINSLAGNTLLNSPTCYAAALLVFAAWHQPPKARTVPTTARARARWPL